MMDILSLKEILNGVVSAFIVIGIGYFLKKVFLWFPFNIDYFKELLNKKIAFVAKNKNAQFKMAFESNRSMLFSMTFSILSILFFLSLLFISVNPQIYDFEGLINYSSFGLLACSIFALVTGADSILSKEILYRAMKMQDDVALSDDSNEPSK